jgi:hypothetical protein
MKAKDPQIDVCVLRELLSYEPETGIFRWKRITSRRVKIGDIAGGEYVAKGYKSISVLGHRVRAHRLAWLYVHGSWPLHDVDHINGKRDDNRLSNLRDVTRSVNLYNQRNVRGTHKRKDLKKNPWIAHISVKNKIVHLGYFPTEEDAHAAYQNAKRAICMGINT